MREVRLTTVDVQWVDATSASGGHWLDPDYPHGIAIIFTRGWLVKRTKRYIAVAASHDPGRGGHWGGDITIPICAVQRLWIGGKRVKL